MYTVATTKEPEADRAPRRALESADELNSISMSHVVLLGAGASRAAFPSGDKEGRRLPVMSDLVELLDLKPLLKEHGVEEPQIENFEEVFASLYEHDAAAPLVRQLERRVRDYFASLELPTEATIYDRLILALRPRDIIATFNWDPLLYLAYQRNATLQRLPRVVALHGSVAVGACVRHRWHGFRWATCGECRQPYDAVQLLYPVRQKNYQADGFIAGQWEALRAFMKHAYWITIFGYSAPETDVEALQLLKNMATENSLREWGDVEIIDIKPHDELHTKWKPFFVRGHYSLLARFEDSVLARYPRRSTETLWLHSMLLQPQTPRPFPQTDDLSLLQEFASELISEESDDTRSYAG